MKSLNELCRRISEVIHQQRCPPRQKSRVECLQAKVKPHVNLSNGGERHVCTPTQAVSQQDLAFASTHKVVVYPPSLSGPGPLKELCRRISQAIHQQPNDTEKYTQLREHLDEHCNRV